MEGLDEEPRRLADWTLWGEAQRNWVGACLCERSWKTQGPSSSPVPSRDWKKDQETECMCVYVCAPVSEPVCGERGVSLLGVRTQKRPHRSWTLEGQLNIPCSVPASSQPQRPRLWRPSSSREKRAHVFVSILPPLLYPHSCFLQVLPLRWDGLTPKTHCSLPTRAFQALYHLI